MASLCLFFQAPPWLFEGIFCFIDGLDKGGGKK